MRPYGYAEYEADPRLRDPRVIAGMQAPYVEWFRGCQRVLDLACGSGIFLDLLAQAGIAAVGVERDAEVAALASVRGLAVVRADVFEFLDTTGDRFDGMYCSHFIEHLPFDRVLRLIELIAVRLAPDGRLVLVFPNPESIRMQLFGFWKDPEHVRLYHADLVESVCRHYGLSVESTNKGEAPLLLGPLTLELPGLEALEVEAPPSLDHADRRRRRRGGPLVGRLARRLGLATQADLDDLRRETAMRLHELRRQLEAFHEHLAKGIAAYNLRVQRAIDALNQIWSRPDEIVMVCRKREPGRA